MSLLDREIKFRGVCNNFDIQYFTFENIMASFCVGGNNFDNSEAKYMKVIGNIYQNPELLEV